jgi:hypothetical protein
LTDFPAIPGKTVLAIRNMATGNESWFVAPFPNKQAAREFAASRNIDPCRIATLRRGMVALKLKYED